MANLEREREKKKEIYRVRSICEVRVSKFEAPIASEPSTLGLLGDYWRPEKIKKTKKKIKLNTKEIVEIRVYEID